MTCPNCGEIFTAADSIDTDWDHGKYYDTVIGVCPNCLKIYRWTEVFAYAYAYDINIEEIKEDE